MNPKDFINFKAVSRALAGNDESIRRGKVPAKYQYRVSLLIECVSIWMNGVIKPKN